MSSIIVSAIQLDTQNNKRENLLKAEKLIKEAAARGAIYVSLPEYFNFIGLEEEEEQNSELIPGGETTVLLSSLAKELNIWLHSGSILERVEGSNKYFNTTIIVNPKGNIISKYRKIHLFDAEIEGGYQESRTKSFGRDIVLCETDFAHIGLSICHDVRYPEIFRILALQGAEIMMVPVAFPMMTGKDHLEVLLRARAIENQSFVISSAQIGEKSDLRCYGRSMIIDPWGNVIATAPDKETAIYAEIDLEYLLQIRRKIPALKNRRTEVYSLNLS